MTKKIALLLAPARTTVPGESLGILSLTSSLRAYGFDVEVYDFALIPSAQTDYLQNLRKGSYALIGLSMNSGNWRQSLALAKEAKTLCPEAHLTAGGYVPSFQPEKTLSRSPYLDSVIRGEGELSIVTLAERVVRGADVPIQGAVMRGENGFTHLEPAPPITDLNLLPAPSRDLLPAALAARSDPWVRISASRGCYGRCSFCSISSFYRRFGPPQCWRGRDPHLVVDEIEHIVDKFGVNRFEFVDDNFFGPAVQRSRRIQEFAQELKQRHLDITFIVEGRASDLDHSDLVLLKQVGLKSVYVGIESGSNTQLQRYLKGHTAEDNRKAILLLRELGLEPPSFGFIMFDYWASLDEIYENCRFVDAVMLRKTPDYFSCPLTLFPGVPARPDDPPGFSTEEAPAPARRFHDERIALLYQLTQELQSIILRSKPGISPEDAGEMLYRLFIDEEQPLRDMNYALVRQVFMEHVQKLGLR